LVIHNQKSNAETKARQIQLKITDYYAIVEKLDILADTNPYLVNLLNVAKAERNNALSIYH